MDNIFSIVFILVILVASIIFHEIAHGVAALFFGDTTAKNAGRLTLNPIPHIDPIGSIMMPVLGILLGGFIFAWAKPVPINPLRFTRFRFGMFCVAIAGIATNVALALFAALCIKIFLLLGLTTIAELLVNIVFLNFILAIFNLLPIPPLDGSKVLFSVLNLPSELQMRIEATLGGFMGFFLLIFLFMSGALRFVFTFADTLTHWLLGI